MGRSIHVVHEDDGWAVRREGINQPISFHREREEAVEMGRDVALDDHVELVVHTEDGKVLRVEAVD